MELLPAPVGDKPRVAVRGAGPVSDVVGSLQHRGQLPGVYLRRHGGRPVINTAVRGPETGQGRKALNSTIVKKGTSGHTGEKKTINNAPHNNQQRAPEYRCSDFGSRKQATVTRWCH